jgi:hypothetical protein
MYNGRTLVACWTEHCVTEFLSSNPLAFTHVSPDVTNSKLCEVLIFGHLFYRCVNATNG